MTVLRQRYERTGELQGGLGWPDARNKEGEGCTVVKKEMRECH